MFVFNILILVSLSVVYNIESNMFSPSYYTTTQGDKVKSNSGVVK